VALIPPASRFDGERQRCPTDLIAQPERTAHLDRITRKLLAVLEAPADKP